MDTDNHTVSTGTRLGSMIVDHLIMSLVSAVFFVPIMLKGFVDVIISPHEPAYPDPFHGPILYVAIIGLALYFCKDCIKGRSVAKLIFKLQVVNNKTGRAASPLQCFIRDIFCILWPVEAIVALAHPSRRIGDYVAGTKLVCYEPEKSSSKFNAIQFIAALILSYGLLFFLVTQLNNFNSVRRARYVESSYNATESKALQKQLNDSLGQYLNADVRIYDKIPGSGLKYVSIAYRLNKYHPEDGTELAHIRRLTDDILYSFLPENSFTGRAKFYYRDYGPVAFSSNAIGTSIGQQ